MAQKRQWHLVDLPLIGEDASIPQILHQIYVGGPLPDAFVDNVRRLRDANRDWEYRFYDDAAAERLIGDEYGAEILATYRSISSVYGAARADLLRYLILYRFGGVYLDLKSMAEKPLDQVIAPDDGFVLAQWDNDPGQEHEGFGLMDYVRHVPGGEFVQWFIACAPGHPMMRAVIERVVNILKSYNPLFDGVGRGVVRVTGPIPFTEAIAPLLDRHRHRLVRDHRTLGLRYSMARGMAHRGMVDARHYTRSRRPIVDRPSSPFARLLIQAALALKALRRWLLRLG